MPAKPANEFEAWTKWADRCSTVKANALARFYAANQQFAGSSQELSANAMDAAEAAASNDRECQRLRDEWLRALKDSE